MIKHRGKKAKPAMELVKAQLLVEKVCYISRLNKIFGNSPSEVTWLNCYAANRPLPCNLCLGQFGHILSFAPSPWAPGLPPLVPFIIPLSTVNITLTAQQKRLKLTKKERDHVQPKLLKFGEAVWLAEQGQGENPQRPRSAYFPSSLVKNLVDKVMSVSSLEDVQVRTQSWSHQSKHLASLFELVILLQGQINAMREEARLALNAANKAKRDAVREVAIHNGSGPSSTDTGKRVAMVPITNRPVKHPRALKEPLRSAAAVTKSFGPLY